jgi:tetratricopeptide (TPR) repeat protein
MDIERINLLCQKTEKKMNRGDFRAALKEVRKIKNPEKDPYSAYMVSAYLIDIGNALGREDIVQEGVDLLEKQKNALLSDKNLKSTVFYNLANGYNNLYLFEKDENPLIGYFNTSKLNIAKEYYLEALNSDNSNDPEHLSKIWTNLGNCYNNFGRVVEALECFEKALKIDPYHGMAVGNKGIALLYYAKISGDHSGTFLNESYYQLSQALEFGVIPESRNYFLGNLKNIEHSHPEIAKNAINPDNFPGAKIEGDSKLERFLVKYCLENKLYLNICNVCQRCSAAVGDTLAIKSMLVPPNPRTKKTDPFLRLASYLNQMKQDYVTARFLFILSRYKELDFSFVDKRVFIVDTHDFNIPNVYLQIARFAFKSFFDVLDKIAIFINGYLKLGLDERKINFRNIWYSNPKQNVVHNEIIAIENFSLNAIFDISRELEEGRHKKLREIRNALTHRFFYITPIKEAVDEENISEEKFVEYTMELARLVRSSLIYLVQFVFEEEQKKERDAEGKIFPIPALNIPDEMKKFR